MQGYQKENANTANNTMNNHLSWDEYFMSIAVLTSLRSKDESTKVGSVLVSQDNKILGL